MLCWTFSIPQVIQSLDATVQTDPTPTPQEYLDRLVSSSNTISQFFVQEGLDHLCFPGKPGLLELRAKVEGWRFDGGDLSKWNQMAEESVKNAEESRDINYLKPVLSKFEEKKSAGEFLLYLLNTWTIEDWPSDIADALIAFKARTHLITSVAEGLGLTERWIGILTDRLGHVMACELDEECLVEAELLSQVY